MGVDRVLDRQLVQLELAPDRVELLLGRARSRPIQTKVSWLVAGLDRVVEVHSAVAAASALVHGAVDDHVSESWRRRRASCTASSRVLASPA